MALNLNSWELQQAPGSAGKARSLMEVEKENMGATPLKGKTPLVSGGARRGPFVHACIARSTPRDCGSRA